MWHVAASRMAAATEGETSIVNVNQAQSVRTSLGDRVALIVSYPLFVAEYLPYGIFRSKIDGDQVIREVLLGH